MQINLQPKPKYTKKKTTVEKILTLINIFQYNYSTPSIYVIRLWSLFTV